jgi:amino acid permease
LGAKVFESIYKSIMTMGPRLLVAVAVIMFFASLLMRIPLLQRSDLRVLGADNQLQLGWLELAGVFISAFSGSVLPLVGALVVERLDRLIDAPKPASD